MDTFHGFVREPRLSEMIHFVRRAFGAGYARFCKTGTDLQVLVHGNNVDQALKALKNTQLEGIFREMKLRGQYEKPSEKRARESAEAIRRARNLARKALQREDLLPMKPSMPAGVVARRG